VQDLEAANSMEGVDLNDADKVMSETTDSIKGLANFHTNGGSDSPPIAKQTVEIPMLSETSVCKDGYCMEIEKQATKGTDCNEETSRAGGSYPFAEEQSTVAEVGSKRKTRKISTSCSLGSVKR